MKALTVWIYAVVSALIIFALILIFFTDARDAIVGPFIKALREALTIP